MRLYCVWCRRYLGGADVCEVLPAGCLWPWGSAICTTCCVHAVHGLPPERQAA